MGVIYPRIHRSAVLHARSHHFAEPHQLVPGHCDDSLTKPQSHKGLVPGRMQNQVSGDRLIRSKKKLNQLFEPL